MWYWNPKAARYQWRNGRSRFLKRSTVLGYVQETIDATGQVTDTLSQLVSDGMLSPADWREMMRRHIKAEHIRQGVLAAGGRENMTPRRWGLVGAAIKDQYNYLDKFTDLVAEDALSEAQIAARSRMYLNAAREAFERVNMDVHQEAGFDEVRWIIDAGAENCPDCLELAGMGWQKIEDDPFKGCWPGSGCTVCLCITTPECRVLTRNGWIPMLDIVVGDMVFTHNNRWKPVTSLVIKTASKQTQETLITSPSGVPIGCTLDHLWYTASGWRCISHIDKNELSMYYIPIPHLEVGNGEKVHIMRYRDAFGQQDKLVQIMSVGMSLREYQRFPSQGMQIMRDEAQSQKTMGRTKRVHLDGNQKSKPREQDTAGGFGGQDLASSIRWPEMELVLAEGEREKSNNLPLSVGMDNEQRAYSRRSCYSPQRPQSQQRRAREFGACGGQRPSQIARENNTSKGRGEYADMDLPILQQGIQELSTREGWRSQILQQRTCSPGAAIYDLTVKDDASFIIEGLVSHNTNCRCHLEYRKSEEA